MTQLTVRGFDAELEHAIRELARRRGISLSKAALELMRKGSGLAEAREQSDRVGQSLDHLFGTWSDEAAEGFLAAIDSCNQVDEELWR